MQTGTQQVQRKADANEVARNNYYLVANIKTKGEIDVTSKKESAGGGIGFCGLLTLLLIALKLTGYIEWSWWVIIAPLWVPTLIVLGLLIIIGLIYLFVEIVLD